MDTIAAGTARSISWRSFSESNCRSKQGGKMNTEQIAQKVVELVRKQAWHEALDTLYSKDIVSVEARSSDGESAEKRGLDQVRGKTDWWINTMEIHNFKVNGPVVAHDRLVVQYDVDVTDKDSKKRFQMTE